MSKTILEEALEDTKFLRETAIENARNVLVEAISPQIREFIDSQIEEGNLTEMPMELSELDPVALQKILPILMKLMGKDDGGMGMEDPTMGMDDGSAMDMGGPMGEPGGDMPFGDEEEEDPLEDGMYETKENEDDENKEGEEEMTTKKEQFVKIDESDLAKAWAEVVREEALEEAQVPSPTVAPAFADAQNPNSNAKGGLGEKGTPGERGLEDKEQEEMWKDETPPAAQDWTVKEGHYKKYITALHNENKALKLENEQLNLGVEKLQRNVVEVNLFNSKLLFSNKLLQNTNLTNEQRLNVIESFDRAESLREVELVFKSLSESLKIAGVLGEGKQTATKRPRASRFTTSATANMLREQAGKTTEEKPDVFVERMQKLAGVLGD